MNMLRIFPAWLPKGFAFRYQPSHHSATKQSPGLFCLTLRALSAFESHIPRKSHPMGDSFLVRLMRFERTAHSVGGCCSIQLSYRRILNIFKADSLYYPLFYYIILGPLFQVTLKALHKRLILQLHRILP